MRVNLLDPGVVRTRMRAQAFPGELPESVPAADSVTDWFVTLAGADAPHGKRVLVPAARLSAGNPSRLTLSPSWPSRKARFLRMWRGGRAVNGSGL
ncbi:MAG: hypothetical protein WDN72_09075 [Alphaproteobacteria bacterium]